MADALQRVEIRRELNLQKALSRLLARDSREPLFGTVGLRPNAYCFCPCLLALDLEMLLSGNLVSSTILGGPFSGFG